MTNMKAILTGPVLGFLISLLLNGEFWQFARRRRNPSESA